MARTLIIAYTKYIHDSRVRRHAEALAERGDAKFNRVAILLPGDQIEWY